MTGLKGIKVKTKQSKDEVGIVDNNEDIKRGKKLELISQILNLYFAATKPDNTKPYWYGDVFDKLYDKEIIELISTLSVYKVTKTRNHI